MTRQSATCLVVTVLVCLFVVAGTGAAQGNKPCATIQGGQLLDERGNALSTGYDEYEYNYGAHNFGGFYANWDRPDVPQSSPWQWADDQVAMTWNDAWLSNKDCDGDGVLDRPDSYQGSGAAVVIHFGGICDNLKQWTRQVELSAVPADAVAGNDGLWYFKGKKLGRQITIALRDTLNGALIVATGLAVTKDSINNSCPAEHDHATRFAFPVAPHETIVAIQ